MKFLGSALAVFVASASLISPTSSWSTLSHPVRTNAIATTSKSFSASSFRLFSASAVEPTVDNISKYKVSPGLHSMEDGEEAQSKISIPAAASVFVATVGTFAMNNYNFMSIGAVGASGLTGLLAALVLPEQLAIAALCGSFAGMAKLAVIPGMWSAGILGVICAGLYTVFEKKKWLDGVGGRLGFIAQCACTLQFLVSAPQLFNAPNAAASFIGEAPKLATLLADLPTVISFTMLGALFVRYWKDAMMGTHIDIAHSHGSSFSFLGRLSNRFSLSVTRRLATSVGAVGATGLLASLLLPASVAGPAFCGAFIAKSAPKVLPTVNSLVPACIFAGIAQQALSGVMLGGWGGKLGTGALMGVLGYTLIRNHDDLLLLEENDLEGELPEETMVKAFGEATTSDTEAQPRREVPGTSSEPSMMQASDEPSILQTTQEPTVPAQQVPVVQAAAEPAMPEAQAAVDTPAPAEPSMVNRQVYTYKAANQAPVLRSSVASVDESVKMSVLMAVEGKMETDASSAGAEDHGRESEEPTEVTRTPVYSFKADNQAPVRKTSVASSDDSMEMSVLLTVEGKLEDDIATQSLPRENDSEVQENVEAAPQASYYEVRRPSYETTSNEAPRRDVPMRSFQADAPVFASEGNQREYAVPAVIPVRQEVMPSSVEIGPHL
ncbi:expressed unknown protein [Seminavis robusta]|uniref:Uncharacterized protein n=1 Tax=Seminavis robusta TaxID=568900 RepID=A0A9N8EFY5_9STRA|nr:expressed unknown protein [Seminavis robusta]|eukprot:Sro879_g214840.1 n/a (665) ;mRNA; f:14746-16820